jgi:hypothetical protein
LSSDGAGWNPDTTGPAIWDAPRGAWRHDVSEVDSELIADGINEEGFLGMEILSHTCHHPGIDVGQGRFGYLGGLKKMGEEFGTIPNQTKLTICLESKKLANDYCPNIDNLLFYPWEMIWEICNIHKKPPEPEPPPPPERSCYEKYIKGRPIRKWQVGKFIKCLFGG